LISPETLQFIKGKEQPFEFLRQTIDQIVKSEMKPMVLTLDVLNKIVQQKSIQAETSAATLPVQEPNISTPVAPDFPQIETSPKELTEVQNSSPSTLSPDTPASVSASDILADIIILKDPTGLMEGEGRIEHVQEYFRDKFEKLRTLLLKRPDCNGALTIEQAKTQKSSENKVKIIGMVLEKKELSAKTSSKVREVTANSISIELDDLESTMTVVFSGKNEDLIKKANRITHDQVICVEGFVTQQNTVLIASEFFWPDVPFHQKKPHDIPPISAVFLSDTHFGSKFFAAAKFEAFLEWLQGEVGTETQQALAKSVKYLVIAGDLIDGIGVYPTQEDNLAIFNISEQYELAAKYLKRIPKHIKILIIPGGPHDAVRKAYPQPALTKKYAQSLYTLENVILLGNPAHIRLHGVYIVIFHGDSIDDLIRVIPGLDYHKPAEIMKNLLVSRHLTPIYGSSTWIAPEREDWMILDEIPEILHCGHTHVSDFKEYRGTILINSGTFQEETDYQRSLGIKPTPGKIPLINLQTLKVKFLQF